MPANILYFNKTDSLFSDPSLVYCIACRTPIKVNEYAVCEKYLEPSYNIFYTLHGMQFLAELSKLINLINKAKCLDSIL